MQFRTRSWPGLGGAASLWYQSNERWHHGCWALMVWYRETCPLLVVPPIKNRWKPGNLWENNWLPGGCLPLLPLEPKNSSHASTIVGPAKRKPGLQLGPSLRQKKGKTLWNEAWFFQLSDVFSPFHTFVPSTGSPSDLSTANRPQGQQLPGWSWGQIVHVMLLYASTFATPPPSSSRHVPSRPHPHQGHFLSVNQWQAPPLAVVK